MEENEKQEYSVNTLLKNNSVLDNNIELIKIAEAIFEYTQFLLDDDGNITKTGNLNSSAKEKLNERILELILPEEIEMDNVLEDEI